METEVCNLLFENASCRGTQGFVLCFFLFCFACLLALFVFVFFLGGGGGAEGDRISLRKALIASEIGFKCDEKLEFSVAFLLFSEELGRFLQKLAAARNSWDKTLFPKRFPDTRVFS